MSKQIAVIMDPIESIKPEKDTTLAIMLAAQQRNWHVHVLTPNDMWLLNGVVYARYQRVQLIDDAENWFTVLEGGELPLHEFDIVLMRKDPPFDMEYVYATYLLELAEAQGTLVVNKPQGLRDANEKLMAAWFPECMPPTLVTHNANQLRDFINHYQDVVLKPLDRFGGGSIFRLTTNDVNINVVIETLTNYGTSFTMAQQFISEISEGDKRIILIDGEPIPYALARIPAEGEIRGNLAAGGKGVGVELTDRDRWLCEQVGPTLKRKGLLFVGLDVIGDYITEINVTSPTCVREIEAWFDVAICDQFLDCLEAYF